MQLVPNPLSVPLSCLLTARLETKEELGKIILSLKEVAGQIVETAPWVKMGLLRGPRASGMGLLPNTVSLKPRG